MPELRAKAEEAVDRLSKQAGVKGAAIATRDGLPAVSRLKGPGDSDTLCAMGAAALAAGETACIELGAGAPDRLVVEGDSDLVIAGLDDQHILIVLADHGAAAAAIATARKEIQALLAG